MASTMTIVTLQTAVPLYFVVFLFFGAFALGCEEYESAIGDPGMRRDGLRVAIEAWNQCNEVHKEALHMGSPRQADCFDVHNPRTHHPMLFHRVKQKDNKLGISDARAHGFRNLSVDEFAAWKELYLGEKCEVKKGHNPWQFWMLMLKSGNTDTEANICPKDGVFMKPYPQNQSSFPCFGKGCMNMPLIYHKYTSIQYDKECLDSPMLKGSFYGTWDLDADIKKAATQNDTSYYSVTWTKTLGKGSWKFHHVLRTSSKYPWLMLYLRSDATRGFSGGYHYETRGMTRIIPKSPNFKVRFTLEVLKEGPQGQFYLMDIGSCWKNNGKPCDGDVTTDVTRYSEMIINPSIEPWCHLNDTRLCPPYHTFKNGTRVHRNDTANFPYDAYHLHCAPGNAKFMEEPYNPCDGYSNPQPQEILQILPHPVWGEYGYPTKKGEGWIGDPRTWELDVGGLSERLYFYQDPGTKPVQRHWPSIDLGTEIYFGNNETAEWIVSDFDIIIPRKLHS